MKKTLAVVCLAFAAYIPFMARSEQYVQTKSLDSLNKEQLIGVINCLSTQKGDVSQSKIDTCINAVSTAVAIISPTGGDTLQVGKAYKVAWRGNAGEPYMVSLITLPSSELNSTTVTPLGETKKGQNSFEFTIPKDFKAGGGKYQIMLTNKYAVQSKSANFMIKSAGPIQQAGAVYPNLSNVDIAGQQVGGTSNLVYALDLNATGSPQTITRLDFEVKVSPAVATTTFAENPAVVIKAMTVKDETGRAIWSGPVSTSTFTKDTSGVYYTRLMGGLGLTIPVGQMKRVMVYFETNVVDYDRTITIDGYQATSILANGPDNISKVYSFDGPAFVKKIVVTKRPPVISLENTSVLCSDGIDNDGDLAVDMADSDCAPFVPVQSNLVVSAISSTIPPYGRNFAISPSTGVLNKTVLRFLAKSNSASVTVRSMKFSVTGPVPKSVSVYDSSNKLFGTVIPTGNTFEVSNMDVGIGKNVTAAFTVKADFGSDVPSGSTFVMKLEGVSYFDGRANTSVATDISGYMYGLYSAVANIIYVDTPIMDPLEYATTTVIRTVFSMEVEATGGNVSKPQPSDFKVVMVKNGVKSYVDNVSVVTTPNQLIADGATQVVTVTAVSIIPKQTTRNDYSMYIESFKWSTAATGVVTQTWGLNQLVSSPYTF